MTKLLFSTVFLYDSSVFVFRQLYKPKVFLSLTQCDRSVFYELHRDVNLSSHLYHLLIFVSNMKWQNRIHLSFHLRKNIKKRRRKLRFFLLNFRHMHLFRDSRYLCVSLVSRSRNLSEKYVLSTATLAITKVLASDALVVVVALEV